MPASYRRRAREERLAARAAITPEAAREHLELATKYDAVAAALERVAACDRERPMRRRVSTA